LGEYVFLKEITIMFSFFQILPYAKIFLGLAIKKVAFLFGKWNNQINSK
jgi:hypothetical protein